MAKRISTIKKELIKKNNFTEEMFNNMSDDDIRKRYDEIKDESVFDNRPTYIFYDNEKVKKGEEEYIRIIGLRRVAEETIGKIVNQQLATNPLYDNGSFFGAWATLTITFKTKDGELLSFSDSADSNITNSDRLYGRYPFALATTRAEARIYRKALNLDIVAAEELMDEEDIDIGFKDEMANDSQKRVIQGYIDSNGISLSNLLDYINEEQVESVDMLSFEAAKKITRVAMSEKDKIIERYKDKLNG